MITGNLPSHDSCATRDWLAGHPRIRHAFIPADACWLNLQGLAADVPPGHRRTMLADPGDIDYATQVAAAQLNARAKPWI